VAFLAILLLAQGVLLIALGAIVPFFSIDGALSSTLVRLVDRLLAVASLGNLLPAVAQAILGIAALAAGVGIIQVRPWAWHMAMALQGVILVVLLIEYFFGDHNYLDMLLAAIIALYLNWRPIRQAFEVAQQRAGMVRSVPLGHDVNPRTPGAGATMPMAAPHWREV
jgi:hypothetical protein